MGLFTKKPKITIKEFCTDFYNKILHCPKSFQEIFNETLYNKIVEVDKTFSSVELNSFGHQLQALQLEVVGIAWMLNFKVDSSPIQSEITNNYLSHSNFQYLWEMMEPYNQAIAKSTVGNCDSSTAKGRYTITYNNSIRPDFFDEWMSLVSDPKDAARAANRLNCQESWKNKRAHIYLSFALTDQLNCKINEDGRNDINEESRFILMSCIKGFYDGFYEEVSKVKIII